MQKQNISKTATFSFAAMGFLAWWVSGVLFETLAVTVPFAARLRAYKLVGIELYQLGLPFLVGLGVFLYLQLSQKRRVWAEDIVLETSKVVWPGKKDVQLSTVIVSIMLLISGVILFTMDIVSSSVVDLILGR